MGEVIGNSVKFICGGNDGGTVAFGEPSSVIYLWSVIKSRFQFDVETEVCIGILEGFAFN
jgi:hypothetical protein